MSWNDPIGLPNCSRVRAYSMALSRHVLAAPVTPQAIPNLASVRQDSGPFQTGHVGQHGAGRQPDVVQNQFGRNGRAERELFVDVPRSETSGPPRHEEALDALRGIRPYDGDIGDAAVGDPHLDAIQNPVSSVPPSEGPACFARV